jgi:hypothetical protein
VVENLFTNVIKDEHIVYRGLAHGIISAPVASVKTEFLNLTIFRVFEPNFLSLHLNDIGLASLIIVEWSDSDDNLDAV